MAGQVRALSAMPAAVLQLRIELDDLEPHIWRQVLVPDTITLPKLHRVIQVAMGWTDSHLHEFVIRRQSYGTPDPDWGGFDDLVSEKRVALADALGAARKFTYLYDYGDNWRHTIKVQKRLPFDPDGTYPRCIDGAYACPPEDVGGVPGYADLLDVLSDPNHEEHQNLLDWCGSGFDPLAFDLATVNKKLARIKL
jgi:hypothetical protein